MSKGATSIRPREESIAAEEDRACRGRSGNTDWKLRYRSHVCLSSINPGMDNSWDMELFGAI